MCKCDMMAFADNKTCLAATPRITEACPVLSGGKCFIDTTINDYQKGE